MPDDGAPTLSRARSGAALTFDAVSEARRLRKSTPAQLATFAAVGDVSRAELTPCGAPLRALSTAADAAQGLRSLSQEGGR